jgi:hypothetical protein
MFDVVPVKFRMSSIASPQGPKKRSFIDSTLVRVHMQTRLTHVRKAMIKELI